MALAHTSGLMAVNMRATGRRTTCMGKEYTLGPTAESTMDSMRTIRSMGRAHSYGLMVESTMVAGGKASNMGKRSLRLRPQSLEKEFGKMERDFTG